MTKFVVVKAGLEYNDSTYDITNVSGVHPDLFDTEDEAREWAISQTIKDIGNYSLGSIDEYDSGYTARKVRDSDLYDFGWSTTYNEAIAVLKHSGVNWKNILPKLYSIYEVNV